MSGSVRGQTLCWCIERARLGMSSVWKHIPHMHTRTNTHMHARAHTPQIKLTRRGKEKKALMRPRWSPPPVLFFLFLHPLFTLFLPLLQSFCSLSHVSPVFCLATGRLPPRGLLRPWFDIVKITHCSSDHFHLTYFLLCLLSSVRRMTWLICSLTSLMGEYKNVQ